MKLSKYTALSVLVTLGCLLTPAVYAAEIITVQSANSAGQSILGSTVVPYREVTLTAQTPGVVRYVAGEEGAVFSRGAPLIQIDESQLVARRNAVLAQIQTAQASVQNSQAQYTRELVSPRSKDIGNAPGMGLPAMMDMMITRPMADSMMNNYNSDMGRYSDLVSSATGVSQAQSGLQQTMSQLQEIDAALRNTQSIAPFDGVILQKIVEEGDTVQPGQSLLRYGFTKYKRLLADVPSGMIGVLQKDMQVAVKLDGQNERIAAKVSQIYPEADPERHTITVKFDLPVDAAATPGMYAEIYIPNQRSDEQGKAIIPKTALLSGRSLPSVLVVKDATSELRLVRLGEELDSGKVEVLSGVKVGEHIIDNPPPKVASGWMPSASNMAQQ